MKYKNEIYFPILQKIEKNKIYTNTSKDICEYKSGFDVTKIIVVDRNFLLKS